MPGALGTLFAKLPPAREPGRTIPGDPADAARDLVRLLADEARAI